MWETLWEAQIRDIWVEKLEGPPFWCVPPLRPLKKPNITTGEGSYNNNALNGEPYLPYTKFVSPKFCVTTLRLRASWGVPQILKDSQTTFPLYLSAQLKMNTNYGKAWEVRQWENKGPSLFHISAPPRWLTKGIIRHKNRPLTYNIKKFKLRGVVPRRGANTSELVIWSKLWS
jgi:hypothetical protein